MLLLSLNNLLIYLVKLLFLSLFFYFLEFPEKFFIVFILFIIVISIGLYSFLHFLGLIFSYEIVWVGIFWKWVLFLLLLVFISFYPFLTGRLVLCDKINLFFVLPNSLAALIFRYYLNIAIFLTASFLLSLEKFRLEILWLQLVNRSLSPFSFL